MKLNLHLSSTLLSAAKKLIASIDCSDGFVEHIIVVPDRFSLQAEKLVFEMTGKTSLFNVSVRGISSMISRFLKEIGLENKIISAEKSLLLTEKAMREVQNDLIVFKKNSINFVYEVQKAIGQFKSCKINPENLDCKNKLVSSKNKFHDLAIIYSKYQEFLGEEFDANKQIEVFIKNISLFNLENIEFYFAGFDSFTAEVYSLIEALLKSSKSVSVSAARPLSFGNDYIYEKDILQKLEKLASDNNIIVETFTEEGFLNENQIEVAKNLFSSVINQKEGDYYFSFSSGGKQEEVLLAAKLIRNSVYKGGRFNNFAIACSNLDKYAHQIEKIFEEMEIPYFIDKSQTCDKTLLSQTILKLFEVVTSGFSKDNILGFLSSELVEIENKNQLISQVERLNISGKSRFKRFLSGKLGKFEEIFEKIEKGSLCAQCCQIVDEILSVTQIPFEKMQDYLETQGFLKEKNINSQAREIIVEACKSILEFDCNIDAKSFAKKLKLILSFKEVSSVPAFVDSVFVGDATNSFFGECNTLFILGSENLPVITGDCGLISDDDIESSEIGGQISPSIRMINRRNRFKLFCLSTHAKEKLITSFLTVNEEGKKSEKPLFVENLEQLFAKKEIMAARVLSLDSKNCEEFVLATGSRKTATNMLARFFRGGKIDNGNVAALSELLKPDYKNFLLERKTFSGDINRTFFAKGYTKVTQLENYFSCPFKHFARYGLKLEENENGEFDGRDIGNICHKMAELFVCTFNNEVKNLSQIDCEKFASENFDRVLKSEKLCEKFDAAVDKQSLKTYIISQCILVLSRICYELSSSQFQVLAVEKQIDNLYLKFNHGEIKLVGKVDRIDTHDDYFRIVDYKTGRTGGILKDLYYGDKLQLFLYQKAAQKMLNKKSAGALYFDSRWDYLLPNEDDCILKGLLCNDEEALELFDKNISSKIKSDIVPISLSTAKKKTNKFIGQAIAKRPLSVYENYAELVCGQALNEICEGYIAPKPDEDACSNCPYSGLCLHSKEKGFRKKERVKDDEILPGGDNGK